jgi:phosphoribosylformylglycinamidine synthase
MSEALAGIAEACRTLNTPVTGGNVSLYNENPRGAIHPTPTIGMVGIVEELDHITTSAFKREGDVVIQLGRSTDELGGSEYLRVVHGLTAGDAPRIDLVGELALQTALLEAIRSGLVASAHDCAEGGLAVALAESAFGNPEQLWGVNIDLPNSLPPRALLFGEAQGRVVLSCRPEDREAVLEVMDRHDVPAIVLGTVAEQDGWFRVCLAGATIAVPILELAAVYYDAIPRRMDGSPDDVRASLFSEVENS